MKSNSYRASLIGVNLRVMLEWHIGDVVRKMREERQWTQDTLAANAKVSKVTVVRVEAGRETRTKTVVKIARAFGVKASVLFDQIPPTKEDEPGDDCVTTCD